MASLRSLFRKMIISSSRSGDFLAKSYAYSRPSSSLQEVMNSQCTPSFRSISVSAYLCAEPLKKKKKMDPAVIRAREERRKRKIEKQIRRLERNQNQLKPLEELEIPPAVVDDPKGRARPLPQLSTDEVEKRWLLQKEWSRYRFAQHSQEIRMIERLLNSQTKALEELRKESEELYQAAIQFVPNLIPLEIKGPVETPPKPDYEPKEGDFIDISRKWD